jgi:diguanylate cyclase (GGDEF)-like protein
VAQSLYEALLRPTDIIARYGGEEFTVILPNTGSEGAGEVARRMMDSVARLDIVHKTSSVAETVTISIGVSSILPTRKLTVTSLLDRADKALYQAKEEGRNTFRVRLIDQ